MIKNRFALVLFVFSACDAVKADEPEPLQGVVELDERTLAFELAGRILEMPVDEAQQLEEGEVVARIDPTLLTIQRDARTAELRAAEAQLGLIRAGTRVEEVRGAAAELRAARESLGVAQLELQRAERLTSQGATSTASRDRLRGEVSQGQGQVDALEQRLRALRRGARPEEVEVAEAKIEAARQGLRSAEEQLARQAITSPIAATVLDVHLEPGEIVAPGVPVVTIASLDEPYIDVFVPQNRIDAIELGASCRVVTDALDVPMEGTVEHIGRSLEYTPRFIFSERERPNLVLRVRIRISDPQHQLHAGVPARVEIP